jgi:recombinational DNA repair ATPase RecF
VTLAKSATTYYWFRLQLIDFIRGELPFLEHLLEEKYTLQLAYETKVDIADIQNSILSYLTEKQERDIILGYTYVWPHLDDFGFQIQVSKSLRPSTEFLSRGENKTLLLGIKLLVIRFLEKYTTSQICILLDDLFSELDNDHIRLILEACGHHQIFITNQNMSDLALPNREVMVRNII